MIKLQYSVVKSPKIKKKNQVHLFGLQGKKG